MKKLIKLNPKTGRFIELDTIRLKRTAKELQVFIAKNIPKNNDPFNIWGGVMPLCEGVLNGTINAPIAFSDLPLTYVLGEGLLSAPDFEKIYNPFANTIIGQPLRQLDKIEIDGELYAYADFEDP